MFYGFQSLFIKESMKVLKIRGRYVIAIERKSDKNFKKKKNINGQKAKQRSRGEDQQEQETQTHVILTHATLPRHAERKIKK